MVMMMVMVVVHCAYIVLRSAAPTLVSRTKEWGKGSEREREKENEQESERKRDKPAPSCRGRRHSRRSFPLFASRPFSRGARANAVSLDRDPRRPSTNTRSFKKECIPRLFTERLFRKWPRAVVPAHRPSRNRRSDHTLIQRRTSPLRPPTWHSARPRGLRLIDRVLDAGCQHFETLPKEKDPGKAVISAQFSSVSSERDYISGNDDVRV